MDVHPGLAPVAFLFGAWRGEGRGSYPTIDPFSYSEEVSFAPGPGKPFMFYVQRTRSPDGSPLHSEAGYLRMTPGGPELVIAQPTGIVEVHRGELSGTSLDFRSTAVSATPTARAVIAVTRRLTVEADVLSYELSMSYAGTPLTVHLEAVLEQVDSAATQSR